MKDDARSNQVELMLTIAIDAAISFYGKTSAEINSATGISVSYLSMMRNGKRNPTHATVDKIASAIGTQPWIIYLVVDAMDKRSHALDVVKLVPVASAILAMINERFKDQG